MENESYELKCGTENKYGPTSAAERMTPCWFSLLNKRGLFLQGFRDNDIENSVPIMHFKQEAKNEV